MLHWFYHGPPPHHKLGKILGGHPFCRPAPGHARLFDPPVLVQGLAQEPLETCIVHEVAPLRVD
eukprot:7323413-Alexandrium_andersonii.AAC.1